MANTAYWQSFDYGAVDDIAHNIHRELESEESRVLTRVTRKLREGLDPDLRIALHEGELFTKTSAGWNISSGHWDSVGKYYYTVYNHNGRLELVCYHDFKPFNVYDHFRAVVPGSV